MADAINIASAISFARAGQQVLASNARSSARVSALQLNRNLFPDAFAEVRVVLGIADARSAISLAVLSGNGILGALNSLESSAELATNGPLVSSLTNLTIDGTRISQLNLNVFINRSIGLIDALVSRSEFRNANFISSGSQNIQIRTSRFGGSINITPQPLDSLGLNLRGISLLSNNGADDGHARIQTAINTAWRRINNLETLQRTLTGVNFSAASLSRLVSSLSGVNLTRGALINVVG